MEAARGAVHGMGSKDWACVADRLKVAGDTNR